MLLAMLIFGGMSMKYKYVEIEHPTVFEEIKKSNQALDPVK